jgi:hypothetical protein
MTVEMVEAEPLNPWNRIAEVTIVEEVKKT